MFPAPLNLVIKEPERQLGPSSSFIKIVFDLKTFLRKGKLFGVFAKINPLMENLTQGQIIYLKGTV